MRLKENDLLDIAIDKKAFQSSLSRWSKTNDPQRAIDSNLESVDYAFHTNLENSPWWMVDLEKEYAIEIIRIFNRIYCFHEVARKLTIEISKDGKTWLLIHKGLSSFLKAGIECEVVLPIPMKARYVKISLDGKGYLHLSKIQVMIRKSTRPLFIGARVDGLGCRILAILNAMYLAHKENAHFGFIWSEKTNFNGEVFEKEKQANFIGRNIGNELEIFDKKFIEKYSYTNSGLSHNYGINAEKKIKYANLLKEKNYHEVDYLYYISSVDLSVWIEEIDQKDYYENIKTMWNLIEFSADVSFLINEAKKIHKNLGQFISLHIRSGDIIVADGFKNLGNWWYKAMPLEIAMGIIESIFCDANVVVFGDDEELVVALEKYYNKKRKLFSVNSLFNVSVLKDTHRAIFEITLMSYSEKIYTGGSNFARLANLIAFSKNPDPYYKILSLQQRYSYIKKNLGFIKLNSYQKAYSYFYIFMLSRELNFDIEERLKYIKKALRYDNSNDLYRIGILECLCLKQKYKQAEKYISIIIKYRHSTFLPIFINSAMVLKKEVFGLLLEVNKNDSVYLYFLKMIVFYLKRDTRKALEYFKNIKNNIFLKDLIDIYMPGFYTESQKISHAIKKIQEKPLLLGAPSRIKNHLAYRLGQIAVTNSKTIGGYFRLPFNLIKEYKQYNQEQKNYQMIIKLNPTL
ncbi:discoidin domain-containing protein, partial [Campylobacter jejuni]|nr:discoidin domain-containing protein [Campylobacter jejuni]